MSGRRIVGARKNRFLMRHTPGVKQTIKAPKYARKRGGECL